MKDFVEFMAKAIVEHPELVQVQEVRSGRTLVYQLEVSPEDKGRIIGKGGGVADAMRALLRVAALRRGQRVILEIL